MYLGMMGNLVVFKILICVFKLRSQEMVDEHKLTKGNRNFNVLLLWMPAMCDMIGMSTMYIALNLTYASSFQMLRGSVMIFTAILSFPCFRRIPNFRELFGIFLVIVGLIIVGLSDWKDQEEKKKEEQVSKGHGNVAIIGDIMVVASQFLTASESVLEERFLLAKDIPPLQAVGWEGIFGFSTLIVLMIAFNFIYVGEPYASNPGNTLENPIDALVQIGNNWRILVATIVAIISIPIYYFCALSVGAELSATTRQVLDSMRTVIVWIVSCTALDQEFHYLQLIGFLVLLTGMAFYNDVGCSVLRNKCCPSKGQAENQEEQR
ncbi:hypothetical protein HHI36_021402 [Cryptolaemus montrouzieri]